MKWNRPFAPGFLKKFDHKLLLQNPEIWSTRTHWVWYYGILFCSILAGICFLYPDDIRSNSGLIYWIFFVSVVSILGLVFWLIYLLRFNVFKRYGNITGLNRLKVYGLCFASIAMIVFFTYVPAIVESAKANAKYQDAEIANDINHYNKLLNQLEYDSIDHTWGLDTIVVVKDENEPVAGYINEKLHKQENIHVRRLDSSAYYGRLAMGDTVKLLFDSVYQIYTCPQYQKLHIYRGDENLKDKILDNAGIYKTVIRDFRRPDITQATMEMRGLVKKYYFENNRYGYYSSADAVSSNDTTYEHRLENRYHTDNLRASLENIVEKKFRFSKYNLEWEWRVIFYVSLCITLLVFTFRHSTTKTFFLSLLMSIILTILTGLMIAFTNGGEIAFFGWLVFYTIAFGGASFSVFFQNKRNLVTGICINIFVWLITYLPLNIIVIKNSLVREQYSQDQILHPNLPPLDYDKLELHLKMAEPAGIVLLFILLPTLIHKLYRKWYALPEE